jgi:hypothetical protein
MRENNSNKLMHCVAGRTLQEFPLAASLMDDSKSGVHNDANIAITQYCPGSALHTGEQYL